MNHPSSLKMLRSYRFTDYPTQTTTNRPILFMTVLGIIRWVITFGKWSHKCWHPGDDDECLTFYKHTLSNCWINKCEGFLTNGKFCKDSRHYTDPSMQVFLWCNYLSFYQRVWVIVVSDRDFLVSCYYCNWPDEN